MVFHDIHDVIDVVRDYRIIVYYIEAKISDSKYNGIKLFKMLELIMRMLEKKNEDLLIVKVLQNSQQFNQFQELYKSETKGVVTLFAVNNEGIPVICEYINEEEDFVNAIESLSGACSLNCITKGDICKIIQSYTETICGSSCQDTEKSVTPQMTSTSRNILSNQRLSTELQIRLPNGHKEVQTFDKNAKLQEVWIYISVKYGMRDFDMKTYNHETFSEEDYLTTLQELELYPNGVLMVVNKNVPANRVGIGALLQYIFHLFASRTASLVQYVQGFVNMVWNSFPNGRPRPNDRNDRRRINRIESSEHEPDYSKSQARQRRSPSRGFDNNIHTLHRDSDSDDENNRYNGNSTQQK